MKRGEVSLIEVKDFLFMGFVIVIIGVVVRQGEMIDSKVLSAFNESKELVKLKKQIASLEYDKKLLSGIIEFITEKKED